MSEDLVKQLNSYKAQLQQVEVALSTDEENEDLLKLQKDLQEVIDLTTDLLTSQPAESASTTNSSVTVPVKQRWKVGDNCLAVWNQDGQTYEAEIEEIDRENGTAAVTFAGYGNAEVIPLQNLKPSEDGKRNADDGKPKSKKEQIADQREYKKKKAQKKVLRMKELETEREEQKSKWQNFNNKAYSKNKKGQVKRSIFASPESVSGKVGVGTCGIADKPMTQYSDTAKYNVRHLMPQ
ncbi:survival of motor neuron-related-splicing factor 30 [Trematomus bernacchii]|uniref:Survival of motor neuron-related-splicing factor 30 n=1 Tax=Pagothenia borchgrevinki TaxID=8213 RepID=A0ABD2G8M2_PAGBO|nr:survival of motor neuron-related-splicing factor 30 [Trematomus bernacchii]